MSYGFVYLMANDSYEGLYKIGFTNKSPMQRAIELSNTSSPSDFYVLAYAESENPQEYERSLHETYSHKRVNTNREYFKLDEDDIRDFIRTIQCYADNVVITFAMRDLASKFIYKKATR